MGQITENEFLQRIKAGELKFRNLELKDADLSECAAIDLVLRDCKFSNVNMTGVDWQGLSCTSTTFYSCQFASANLIESSFDSCNFFDAEALQGCNFRYSRLRFAAFDNCTLTQSIFEHADLFQVTLENSYAAGANFQGARFHGSVSFNKNTLRFANFQDADFSNCKICQNDLDYAILDGVNFEKANLTGCTFNGSSLRLTNFVGADLRGATIDGFDVRTMDLSRAIISEGQMKQLLANLGIVILPDKS